MALYCGASKGTKSPSAGRQSRHWREQRRRECRRNGYSRLSAYTEPIVTEASPPGGLNKVRIEALTDGVFAIAMTLLIFGVKVPLVTPVTEKTLQHELFRLWPSILTYVVSFVMLGIYWVGHHNQYHYIRRTDRIFLWINIFFLMCVSSIPFTTSLLGQYPAERTALTVYGLNLIMVGGFLYAHWWYATHNHRLVERDTHPEVIRLAKRRILMGPFASAVATGLSFVNSRLVLAIFVLIPLLYLVPGRIDRHWLRLQTQDPD